jgi:glycosyltransferase involved in cell wall biosynthesis
MTEVFIDRPRAAHPLWRLKVWAYRWIARRAIGILTNSSAELETIARRFATPADRLRYVPLHTNIPAPVRSECDDGFVLSAGRTLRDYSTLVRAAERLQSPLVIICGANDLADVRLPGHVTLRREVDRATYLDILGRCSVVALPLLETERSTGQVVLLEAMALGKPVVTTRSPGTIDHVESGRNGILVEVGDHEGLAREVNVLMQDPARRRQLGEAAAADLLDHTFDRHAERKLLAINELWKLHRASHHAESS